MNATYYLSGVTREETLEQWAARVAPTLEAADWQRPSRMAAQWNPDQVRALLAYRDKVAAGLSSAMRRDLCRDWTWPYPHQATVGALQRRGLLVSGTFERTDFGREIARVLGGGR